MHIAGNIDNSAAITMKTVDLKLVGDLFGTGYVMDFTNRDFADFFRNEVGVNIYDDAYAENGNSKGKRLRTFMQRGQKPAIVRALRGLWEYRSSYLSNIDDEVPNSLTRINALIESLGGEPFATAEAGASRVQNVHRPQEDIINNLEAAFMALHAMDDTPQARGYAFEAFLKQWFDAWNLKPRSAFRITGEQIDGSFEHRNTVYFLEAKWRNSQTGASDLRAFQELVGQHFEGARGLFVSYMGFTPDGLQSFTARRIVMMDGMDIYEAIRRRLSLDDVIAKKLRIAVEERRPNVSVRELFP